MKLLWIIVMVFWFGFWCQGRAYADGLPTIRLHSVTKVDVYRGDTVELNVEGDGDGLTYRWLNEQKLLCAAPKCTLDTAGWPAGKHVIVATVDNQAGSVFVTYNVFVTPLPYGKQPRALVPEMMEPRESVESLARDDLFIKVHKGLAYSYFDDRMELLVKRPHQLKWNETLRTHGGGVVHLGRPGRDEHFLLQSSTVELQTVRTGQRLLLLKDGMLRSRNLGEHAPGWTVIVPHWLQVDGDARADVVVKVWKRKKKRLARVMVLRGNARVTLKRAGMPKKDFAVGAATFDFLDFEQKAEDDEVGGAFRVFSVPAGAVLTVPTKRRDPPLQAWSTAAAVRVFKNTTPAYLSGSGWAVGVDEGYEDDEDLEELDKPKPSALEAELAAVSRVVPSANLAKTEAAAVQAADTALAQRDFVAALEQLLPFADGRHPSAEASLRLGQAYRGLRLAAPARQYFNMAQEQDPEAPDVYFQLGMLALENGRWQEARRRLAEAESRGYEDWQAVHYYQGYAALRAGDERAARGHFRYALWEVKNREMAQVTKEFLARFREQQFFGAAGRVSLFSDSNVFKLRDGVERPIADSGSAAFGYKVGGALTLTFLDNRHAAWDAGYKVERLEWADSRLKPLTVVDQELSTTFKLNVGGTREKPAFFSRARGYVKTIVLGDERAADGLGLDLGLSAPQIFGAPEIFLDSALYVDPLPARDDLVDPLTGEVVAVSDRTARVFHYGLGLSPVASLRGDLLSRVLRHHHQLSRRDDYNEYEARLRFEHQFLPALTSAAALGLGSRRFAEAEDGRRDSLLRLYAQVVWQLSPMFFSDAWFEWTKQDSSREENGYAATRLGAGVSAEL